jgi:hypothetical protein
MLYLVLLLAILAFALMGVQQYSLRQRRRGFSLRDGKDRPRRKLFADPEEERMREWLESDEEEDSESL